MDTLQNEQVNQTTLNNLLGGTDGSLIPESLVTTITIGIIALNVIGILFLVVYILAAVRKWKVQSAVLNMQKDVADIKAKLEPQAQLGDMPSTTTNDVS